MNIKPLIINALTPLGVPVALHVYEPKDGETPSPTYITFYEYNQREAISADDVETYTTHSIQVDIYGKGNIETLTKQVKDALKAIGFTRNYEMELYESTSKTYRKSLSFRATLKSN